MAQTIRNPVEWVVDELREVAGGVGEASRSLQHTSTHLFSRDLAVSKITVADLREVLTKGFDDFMAYRTDIIFLIAVYPIISRMVIAASFRDELIPLVFPIVSGSAILGPFVGVFLYEMSRRRELNLQRHHVDSHSWANALSVVGSRSFGKIMMLGMLLVAMYLLWLVCAWGIYAATHAPTTAETAGRFIHDLFLTQGGWWLIIVGCGVGFLFAVAALVTTVVAFPLLLDRDVGLGTAVLTSIRAARANPGPIAAWGLIVAGGLILGAIPLALGLGVVMPVLCDA